MPIGELLGLALPRRVQGRLLDLDFLKGLWEMAAPESIRARAAPARIEKKVLTVLADDPGVLVEAHRRRQEISRRLMQAAGLTDLRLRVRVERRERNGSPPRGAGI